MKSKTYEEFIEKFKPKLTTDDCKTPPLIYDAILEWVCNEYKVDKSSVIRPFWPGCDYTKENYKEGCVVVDNPPFSILSKICSWYIERGIKFFLFSPSLTILSKENAMKMNHIVCDSDIVYENGAKVKTSFVTNLGDGETILQTEPSLTRTIDRVTEQLRKEKKREIPKYEYPYNIVTSAMMQKYSRYGIDFKVKKEECIHIQAMDEQRKHKKGVFGGGLLLSDKAAAKRAAAERAVAERAVAEKEKRIVWELSEREQAIIKRLNNETNRVE